MKKYNIFIHRFVFSSDSWFSPVSRIWTTRGFDYPEELPEKPYNPMKLGLAFEDNLEDNSIYNFGITARRHSPLCGRY